MTKCLKKSKQEKLVGLTSDCPYFLEDDETNDINEFDEETYAEEDEYDNEDDE